MAVGFQFAGTLSGNGPIAQEFVVVDAATLSQQQLVTVNPSTGEVAGAATADTTVAGVAVSDVDNTDDGESVQVYINPDAFYDVTDANIRLAGAKLDIGSGGLTVATDSNSDLVVVKNSGADELTQVMLNGTHYLP